jgi:hypothetical protein
MRGDEPAGADRQQGQFLDDNLRKAARRERPASTLRAAPAGSDDAMLSLSLRAVIADPAGRVTPATRRIGDRHACRRRPSRARRSRLQA